MVLSLVLFMFLFRGREILALHQDTGAGRPQPRDHLAAHKGVHRGVVVLQIVVGGDPNPQTTQQRELVSMLPKSRIGLFHPRLLLFFEWR